MQSPGQTEPPGVLGAELTGSGVLGAELTGSGGCSFASVGMEPGLRLGKLEWLSGARRSQTAVQLARGGGR